MDVSHSRQHRDRRITYHRSFLRTSTSHAFTSQKSWASSLQTWFRRHSMHAHMRLYYSQHALVVLLVAVGLLTAPLAGAAIDRELHEATAVKDCCLAQGAGDLEPIPASPRGSHSAPVEDNVPSEGCNGCCAFCAGSVKNIGLHPAPTMAVLPPRWNAVRAVTHHFPAADHAGGIDKPPRS